MKILQKLTIFALLSTAYGTAWGMESKVAVAAATALVETKRSAASTTETKTRAAAGQLTADGTITQASLGKIFPAWEKLIDKIFKGKMPTAVQLELFKFCFDIQKLQSHLQHHACNYQFNPSGSSSDTAAHYNPTRDTAWSPDNQLVKYMKFKGKNATQYINIMMFYDPRTGSTTQPLPEMFKGFGGALRTVSEIAISPDGQKLVVHPASGFIEVWEITGQKRQLGQWAVRGSRGAVREPNNIVGVAFSPDNQRVIITCANRRLSPITFQQHSYALDGSDVKDIELTYCPYADDNISVKPADKTVVLLDNKTTNKLFAFKHAAEVFGFTWSPCKKYLITLTGTKNTILRGGQQREKIFCDTVQVWDITTQQLVRSTKHYEVGWETYCICDSTDIIAYNIKSRVAISPDGKYLAINNTIYRLDTTTIRFDLPALLVADRLCSIQKERHSALDAKRQSLTPGVMLDYKLTLSAEEWEQLRHLDPFSLRAFMQNLKLLPPVEETAVATSGSAGAAAEAKKS